MGAPATARTPRPPASAGRPLLRALLFLGAVALFLVLAFNGVLLYVRTPSGTARLLRLGLDAANKALAGRVEAESAHIQGDHIVILGAALTDPEGERVAFVERIEVDVVWTALLTGHIEATNLRLIRPTFSVVLDEQGSNLERTFAEKHPGPPTPAARPPPLTFVVRHFDIEQGRYDMRTPEGPPLSLQALALEGSGRFALRSQEYALEARGNGALERPSPGPVTISLQGEHRGNRLDADVDVRAAGASVVGNLHVTWPSSLDGHLALDVPPPLARALVRGWPLRVPLALTAEAKREGAGFLVSGHAAAGKTRLELNADVNLKTAAAQDLRIEARHVDLAELFGRGPETDLDFTLRGNGSGSGWDSAVGQLVLAVPRSRVRGADVGPVDMRLAFQQGRFDVSSLHAVLPGLELRGSGRGTQRTIAANLQLEVSDLAALGKTFGDLLGAVPPLAGQGSLRVEVAGRLTRPGIEATGHFSALEVGPLSATGLEVALKLPDTARPLDASVSVVASQLGLAGRFLREVHAVLGTEGRALSLELTAAAAGPVHLHLGGTSDTDGRGLLLETLVLEFPQGSWALRAPAAVRFDHQRLETAPLSLVSGSQSIALRGRLAEGHLDATLEVLHLDLAHLPALVAPPSLQLAGLLDLTAAAQGPERHPDVTLQAALSSGGWHGLKGVAAQVAARRVGERLSLQGHLQALGSAVEVEAEGPELALSRRIHQPLSLHLSAAGVDVGQALCQLAAAGFLPKGCPLGAAAVQAHASLEGTASGFADGPSLQVTLHGSEVRFRDLPAADLNLSLSGEETKPLALTLSGKALGGSLDVKATLAATTGELLARRWSWAGFRTLSVQGTAEASGLSLASLRESGLLNRDAEGVADARLALSGTLAAPHGTADVRVQKLNLAPWPPGEAHLVVTAGDALDGRLTLAGAAGENGSVHVSVGAGLAELSTSTSPEELAHATLLVEGNLGPFNFRDLPLDATRLRRDRRLLDGTFHVTFEGHGTLLAPTASASVTATGLGPSDGAHFEGTAHFQSAAGRQQVAVKLQSADGGGLDLDGEVQLDLSLPALRHGLHFAEAPLKAHLHSVNFEPDFVAPLVPALRSIGGKLQIEGLAAGTLGQPQLSGSISWTDGSVGIIGFGLYQAIQLQATASNERFAIEKLSARVQGGTLALTLAGTRAADGFSVSGTLATTDLPVVFDDQLWCIATLQADLSGTARPWVLALSQVKLSQVDLQLPEARRKDLQNLSSPPDVVLTRHGVPVDARQAQRALALDPRRRTPAVAGAEPVTAAFLRLALEAPNHIAVRSKDVTLELGLSKPFQVNVGEQQADIFGEVRILKGRGDVWGRRFEVQSGGQVRFAGTPEQAVLDVTGVYSSVQSQAKVYMHISGEVTDVKLTPSSDPPMSESEIYTLLATGRTSLVQSNLGSSTEVGGGEAGASILGSWAATQLKKAVGVALPIDVLSVEVGNDERGINQTRLEAGKYLTDDIYIGYQARINADPFRYQNSNAIRVEYRFLRRWSLQLEYGDANAGSLDAVWSRDY